MGVGYPTLKVIVYGQSGNRCVAAHAIAHMLRIFANVDFGDKEKLNIWQINKQKDVFCVVNQKQK